MSQSVSNNSDSSKSYSGIYIVVLILLLIAVCVYAYLYVKDLQDGFEKKNKDLGLELEKKCNARVAKESYGRNFLIKSKGAGNKCLSVNNTNYSLVNCLDTDPTQRFYYDVYKSNMKTVSSNACLGITSDAEERFYVDPQCSVANKYSNMLVPLNTDKGPSIMTDKGMLYYDDNKFGIMGFRRNKDIPDSALNFELVMA